MKDASYKLQLACWCKVQFNLQEVQSQPWLVLPRGALWTSHSVSDQPNPISSLPDLARSDLSLSLYLSQKPKYSVSVPFIFNQPVTTTTTNSTNLATRGGSATLAPLAMLDGKFIGPRYKSKFLPAVFPTNQTRQSYLTCTDRTCPTLAHHQQARNLILPARANGTQLLRRL